MRYICLGPLQLQLTARDRLVWLVTVHILTLQLRKEVREQKERESKIGREKGESSKTVQREVT